MTRRLLTVAWCGLASIGAFGGCYHRAPNQVEHALVSFDVSPDGKNVVFSSASGDLFLLDLHTRRVRRLTDTSAKEMSPSFAPDGDTIVYAARNEEYDGTSIFVRSLDGEQVQQLTADRAVSDSLPRFSPDGSRIVFARARLRRPYSMGGLTWDHWDVYVVGVDGRNLERVTERDHYNINRVLFSRYPDTVLYSAEADRLASQLVVNVFEASRHSEELVTPVTSPPRSFRNYSWGSEPALSPDGDSLVFVSDRNEAYEYEVFLLNRGTAEVRPLGVTTISRYNRNPLFANDGKSILFLAGRERNASSRPIFSLWMVDSDGSNVQEIADSGLFTNPLKWDAEKGGTEKK